MHKQFNRGLYNPEKMPNDWNITLLCPVYSNARSCNSAIMGVSLLNVKYKIFTTII